MQHHDPKPKDSDSDEDANIERRKPEGSRLPAQREKAPAAKTSDVSCFVVIQVHVQYMLARGSVLFGKARCIFKFATFLKDCTCFLGFFHLFLC